jgi:hypothetical protein
MKITVVESGGGLALETCAGISRANDTPVSKCIFRTLRGRNVLLQDALHYVRAMAERRLAPHVRRVGGGWFFIAAAIRHGRRLKST